MASTERNEIRMITAVNIMIIISFDWVTGLSFKFDLSALEALFATMRYINLHLHLLQ